MTSKNQSSFLKDKNVDLKTPDSLLISQNI
jgi:hypothetical protein